MASAYLLAACILGGPVSGSPWGFTCAFPSRMRFVAPFGHVGFVNSIGVLIFLAQLPQLGWPPGVGTPSPLVGVERCELADRVGSGWLLGW